VNPEGDGPAGRGRSRGGQRHGTGDRGDDRDRILSPFEQAKGGPIAARRPPGPGANTIERELDHAARRLARAARSEPGAGSSFAFHLSRRAVRRPNRTPRSWCGVPSRGARARNVQLEGKKGAV